MESKIFYCTGTKTTKNAMQLTPTGGLLNEPISNMSVNEAHHKQRGTKKATKRHKTATRRPKNDKKET